MKQQQKEKRVYVFSILIFIMCGLLAIYTVISAYSVTKYIKEMLDSGSITLSDSFLDILSYYVSNCGIYIIYISLFLAIWWTKRSITAKPRKFKKVEVVETVDEEDEEDEEMDLLEEAEARNDKNNETTEKE